MLADTQTLSDKLWGKKSQFNTSIATEELWLSKSWHYL